MNRIIVWLLSCFWLVFCSNQTLAQDRYALVIGNANYQEAPLDNPINDAKEMADVLTKVGFEVNYRLDVKEDEFVDVVETFYASLPQGAVSVFFYSGHGVQAQGNNYFVPVDVESKIQSEDSIKKHTYGMKALLDAYEKSQSQLVFFFLDACRNNPFAKTKSLFGTSVLLSKGLARQDISNYQKDMLIHYAVAPGLKALDGHGDNSPFTLALSENIPEKGIDAEAMMRRVKRHVIQQFCGGGDAKACKNLQNPWFEGSNSQTFCFAGCARQDANIIPKIRMYRKAKAEDWDALIHRLLVAHYDDDSSGFIDSIDELKNIPCHVVKALEQELRLQHMEHSLIGSYGFDNRLSIYAGYRIGLDEGVRAAAFEGFKGCLSKGSADQVMSDFVTI